MNQLCYCTQPLEANRTRDHTIYTCRNCCIEFTIKHDGVAYACSTENCFYKEVSGGSYSVCPDCYAEEEEDKQHESNTENRIEFILNKFTSSMTQMS